MTLGSSATLSLGLLPLMATSLTLSTLSGPLRPEPVGTDVPARWPGPCAPGGRWYTSAPTTAAPPAAKATTAKLTSRRGRLAAGRYRPGRRFTRGHATASPPMPAAVPKPPPEGTSVAARLLEPWPTSRVAGSGADRSTPVLVPGPGPRRCGARCGPRSKNAPGPGTGRSKDLDSLASLAASSEADCTRRLGSFSHTWPTKTESSAGTSGQ